MINDHSQKFNINRLLANLKTKIKNFQVIDNQGQLIGKVKDLIIDENSRLNLVISQPQNPIQENEKTIIKELLALLWSQKIQKIETQTKSIFLNVDASNIEYILEDVNNLIIDYRVVSDNSTIKNDMKADNLGDVSEETIVRLLEEQLVVNSNVQKVGEVIVRKEIETRMIQVPVRREKLIVEQVSPEHKQLAEIDLALSEISEIVLTEVEGTAVSNFAGNLTVSGEFSSPKIASLLLNAIALEKNHGCQRVRVSILCEDELQKQKYQEWFDRCSKGHKPKSV